MLLLDIELKLLVLCQIYIIHYSKATSRRQRMEATLRAAGVDPFSPAVKIRAATGSNCMFCVHAQRELNLARGYRNHTLAQACHNTS